MSIVGRRKIDHPALGTAGGTALYASIENIYSIISNDLSGRYYVFSGLANSGTITLDHNLGVPISDIRVMVYTGTHPNFTPITDLIATGWVVAPTSGFTTTKIDVTAPSTGGPFTGGVFLIQDRDLASVTAGAEGQSLFYDAATNRFKNSYTKWTSEAASITANVLTPSTGKPTQRITSGSALQMIAGPTADKVIALVNETGSDIIVSNDTGATAANRIYTGTGNSFTFKNQSAVIALYDTALQRWILIGGGGGTGGLSPVSKNANFTAVLNEKNLVDISAATVIGTLPVTTQAAVCSFTDTKGAGSSSKYIQVTPGAGDSIDGNAVGDSEIFTYPFASVTYYKAAGSTVWYGDYQLATGSGAGTSGGLNPVTTAVSLSAVTNTMYEVDASAGTVTLTLPGGTTAATVGFLDSRGILSSTKKVIIAPASGQSIDEYVADDTISFQYPNAQAVFYRSAGTTVWKGQYQTVSTVQGGLVPGKTDGTPVGAGFIGERIVASSGGVFISSGTSGIFTDHALPLTAGEWDVSFVMLWGSNGATMTGGVEAFIGTAAGNNTTGRLLGDNYASCGLPNASNNVSLCVSNYRIGLSAPASVYLKTGVTYTAGQPLYAYRISARRAG